MSSITPPTRRNVSVRAKTGNTPGNSAAPPTRVNVSVRDPDTIVERITSLRQEALSALDEEFAATEDDEALLVSSQDDEALTSLHQEFSNDEEEKDRSVGKSSAGPSRVDISIRDENAAAVAANVRSQAPPSRVDMSMIVESADTAGLATMQAEEQALTTPSGRHPSVGLKQHSAATHSSSVNASSNVGVHSAAPPSRVNMSVKGEADKTASIGEESADTAGAPPSRGQERALPTLQEDEELPSKPSVSKGDVESGFDKQKDNDASDENVSFFKKNRRMLIAWLFIILALLIILTSIFATKKNGPKSTSREIDILIPTPPPTKDSFDVTAEPLGEELFGDKDLHMGESLDLSSDGDFLAIGSNELEDSTETGQVKVMEFIDEAWVQVGNAISGVAGDNFGSSVQLESYGEFLVAGASGSKEDSGDHTGYICAYQLDKVDDKWKQFGSQIHGDTVGDRFGVSLSMSMDGTSWIAGADKARGPDNEQDGYAKVYDLSDGDWLQKGSTISGSNESRTGAAVAMSGDGSTICVGDRWYKLANGEQKGRARCFEWDEVDWISKGSDIVGTSEDPNGQMGFSISLSYDGSRVAVGDREGGDSEQGSVSVFEIKDDDWERMGSELIGSDAMDRAGMNVKLSFEGDVLLWTSERHDNMKGSIIVSRWDDSEWVQLVKILGSNETVHYGRSAAISLDGSIVAASAHGGEVDYVSAYKMVSP